MPMRIDVVAGYLNATRNNSVSGKIELADGQVIWLELSGNLQGNFSGRSFSFNVNRSDAIGQIPAGETAVSSDNLSAFHLQGEVEPLLALRQIGAIGDVEFREAKTPLAPIEELMTRIKLGETPPFEVVDLLYLEWYGQSGRVVAEIVNAEIEWIDRINDTESSPAADPLFDQTDDDRDEKSEGSHPFQSEETVDPFNLFPTDLDDQIRQSLDQDNCLSGSEPKIEFLNFGEHETTQPRDWSEVIPGIDPETKALYESWDEIYSGQHDQPIDDLFCGEFEIPSLDSIQTDEQADTIVKVIVARLAPFNVAIDFCEHMTPLTALKMIVEEILPIAKVHPNLAATEIIQHYSTFEYCEACEKEFDAEYDKYHE